MQYLQEPQIIHLFQLSPSLPSYLTPFRYMFQFAPRGYRANSALKAATFITAPHSPPAPLYNIISSKFFHHLRGVCLSPSTCSISPASTLNPAWTLLEPGPGRCSHSHSQPPWTKPGFPWQPQRVHVCKGVSLQLQSPGLLQL